MLTIADRRLGRLSWFSPEGEHRRTGPGAFVGGPGFAAVVPVQVTPEGQYWAEPPNINMMAVADRGLSTMPLRITDDRRQIRSIEDLDIAGVAAAVDYGTGHAVFQNPLTVWPLRDYHRDGTAVTIVEQLSEQRGRPGFRLTRIRHDGTKVLQQAYRVPGQLVTASARDSIYIEYSRLFSRGKTPEAALAEAKKRVTIPAHYPAVTALVVTASGDTWVRLEAPDRPDAQWLVIDDAGGVEGRVHAPHHMRVLAVVGNVVWGAVRDSLDVPYIVRYRLVQSNRR